MNLGWLQISQLYPTAADIESLYPPRLRPTVGCRPGREVRVYPTAVRRKAEPEDNTESPEPEVSFDNGSTSAKIDEMNHTGDMD